MRPARHDSGVKQDLAHPVRVDAAFAAATFVAIIAPSWTALLNGTPEWGPGSPALATTLAGLLFLRRRWPITVMLISVSCAFVLRISELTEVGLIWPASAALFTVAAGRTRHWLAWVIGAAAVPLINGPFLLPDSRTEIGFEALWVVVVLAVARAYRNLQGWRAETAARMNELEQQRDLESQRAAAQERLLMAQELHDVVAHTLTVVGVQLRVADEALDDSPEEARLALRTAQEVRGKAAADLRSLVDVLRERESLAPQGDLEGIRGLVSGTQMETLLNIEGDPSAVPAPVALATYRIVQEALTNAVRHSGADRVRVELLYTPTAVHIGVGDDGRGGPVGGTGHGIAGMRERVTALGGTFYAGPAGGGGFVVKATLPVKP